MSSVAFATSFQVKPPPTQHHCPKQITVPLLIHIVKQIQNSIFVWGEITSNKSSCAPPNSSLSPVPAAALASLQILCWCVDNILLSTPEHQKPKRPVVRCTTKSASGSVSFRQILTHIPDGLTIYCLFTLLTFCDLCCWEEAGRKAGLRSGTKPSASLLVPRRVSVWSETGK